jgi:peptidoglycan hydrolase-like protein with peptidoglycan-binding domain
MRGYSPLLLGVVAVGLIICAAFFAQVFPRIGLAPLRLMAAVGEAASTTEAGAASSSSATVIDALQQLHDQQQGLATVVADLQAKSESAGLENTFTRTLRRGDSGADVKELQGFLEQLSLTTASSSATGYYGRATSKAVSNLQSQVGIKQTGIFDRATRSALIELLVSQATSSASSSLLIDPSSIPDPQQEIQDLKNQVAQLSSQLSDTQTTLSDLQNQISDLTSTMSGLQTSVTSAAPAPAPAPAPTPTPAPAPSASPSHQPLAISNIQAGSITTSSAIVTWTTNNPSSSEVDYSLNSLFPVAQTKTVTSSALTTTHSVSLPGLSSGATYHYRVISKDAAGSTASSSSLVFTTQH